MGRGRQKAKQTKVARQLKYFSPVTDYDALQRELAANGHADPYVERPSEDVEKSSEDVDEADLPGSDGEVDEYARWAAQNEG